MISKSVIKLSNSSRSRKLSTRSVTKREIKMALAGRAEAAEEVASARPHRIKGNLPEAVRRRNVMTRVMKEMKRKLVRKSYRKPLKPCALTEAHLCTPLTASLNSGHVKSMLWSQR